MRGRPPIDPARVRAKHIATYLTEEESEWLKNKAHELKMSMSDYIRDLLLDEMEGEEAWILPLD